MKNKALLVGINDYASQGNDLRGCINDIEDMSHFIANKNKVYAWENIRTITDSRATKKGILQELDWLIDGAAAGDQILFHYSGHGAQQDTKHPMIEKDGLDEIICPYDFNDHPATAISDKEFAQRFAKIPQGVHFVWISDSCHAADLSREVVEKEEEGLELESKRYRQFKRTKNGFTRLVSLDAELKEALGLATSILNGALLSGCASHQLSADAYINNRFNGAFTHYLIKNLNLYGTSTTMKNIIKYVNIDLAKNGYDQNPQIEGALAEQSFFKI
jgi:uncharacterized caspase-like protein